MTRLSPARCSLALAFAALLASCGRDAPAASRDSSPARAGDTAAVVNGVPISSAEVALVGAGRHGLAPGVDADQRAIDLVIGQELAAQRAAALGLEPEPAAREAAEPDSPAARQQQRARLADALYRYLAASVRIDPTAVRAYYDSNRARIHTELRVGQILVRDRAAAEAAAAELAAGTPFAEVAARRAGGGHGVRSSWDLGYLRWTQVPAEWSAALAALAPGAVTPIIEGPNHRYWILQLLDRRYDAALTFEAVRPMIEQWLVSETTSRIRAGIADEMRASARIVVKDGGAG